MNATTLSTHAELLRLRKWPAVWIIVAAWLALSVMFGYMFNYISYRSGEPGFANEGASVDALLAEVLPANVPSVLVQGMPMFGGALMLVLGAIVAGNGYGWGTWKTVFTQGPSRSAAASGLIVALTVFVVGVLIASMVIDLGLSLSIASVESRTISWPSIEAMLRSMGAGFLVLEMWALAGFLLGTMARSPALSVGLGLVWALVIENLLRGVGALLAPIEWFTTVLPGTAAGSLVGSIVGPPAGGDTTPGVLDTLAGAQASWTVAAYVVLLPALALWLLRRRDIT